MKRILLFGLIASLLLPGCAIFKKRETDKTKSSFSQTSESSETKNDEVVKTDKSIIVENRTVIAPVYIPEEKVKSEKSGVSLSDLSKGVTSLDSGLYKVTTTYDSAAKKLKTEVERRPEKRNVKQNDSKTTYSDKTEKSNSNSQKENKDGISNENSHKGTKNEPKGLGVLWLIVISVFIVLVLGLLWYLKPWRKK